MAVTLGIYYLVPWIRWDRGPYLPDQAVLIDLPLALLLLLPRGSQPQEFYFVTRLLVLAALALFPGHVDRWSGVVRLYVSADRVDRPHDRGRALQPG
ncbi:MAG: hypothetical protein R3D01_04430 [Hyphomicrobiales bacterium]